jgi:hypothetical protein
MAQHSLTLETAAALAIAWLILLCAGFMPSPITIVRLVGRFLLRLAVFALREIALGTLVDWARWAAIAIAAALAIASATPVPAAAAEALLRGDGLCTRVSGGGVWTGSRAFGARTVRARLHGMTEWRDRRGTGAYDSRPARVHMRARTPSLRMT